MTDSNLSAAQKLLEAGKAPQGPVAQMNAESAPLQGPAVDTPKPAEFPKDDRKYVVGKSANVDPMSAGEQAAEILVKHGSRIRMAEIQYAAYLAPEVISSQGSVATGPDFPYHLAWIANDIDRVSQAVSRGYAPLKMSDERFSETLIVGEDALNMLIDRSARMMRHYGSQKVKLPSELPERLKGKWGFFIPPFVDESTKCIVWGRKQLWFCPREVVNERKTQMQKINRSINPNKTDANFLQDEVGGQVDRRIVVDLEN